MDGVEIVEMEGIGEEQVIGESHLGANCSVVVNDPVCKFVEDCRELPGDVFGVVSKLSVAVWIGKVNRLFVFVPSNVPLSM